MSRLPEVSIGHTWASRALTALSPSPVGPTAWMVLVSAPDPLGGKRVSVMGWDGGQGLGTSGRLPEGISEGGHREGHRSQARTWVCPQRGPLGTNGLYWVELFPWTIDSPGTNPTLTGIFTC